jgi:hypothetical protein
VSGASRPALTNRVPGRMDTLLVALWKFVSNGVVIEGAVMKAA